MPTYIAAPELTEQYIDTVWEKLPHHLRPPLLLPCPTLSAQLRCELTLASETFQYTGSFKFRAAYNLLSSIPQQRVVTASSGNFGQAVAYACKLLGKTCTVVMPMASAQVKIDAVRSSGGIVDLVAVRQVSRAKRVAHLLAEQSDAFQAPQSARVRQDDYRVVAGNSPLGKEIFGAGTFDVVVVPVGGGGLSSGIVIARDHAHARTEVIGAEAVPGNDAVRSLHSGQLSRNEQEPAPIADGARSLSLGKLNWEILQRGIADILEVPDSYTVQAVQHCFRYVNLNMEPTGGLAIGALVAHPERFAGKRVCCIISGGNVDPMVYAGIITSGV